MKKRPLFIIFTGFCIFFLDNQIPSFAFGQQPKEASVEIKESFVYDDHGNRDPLWQLVLPNGAIVNYDTDFLISDLMLEGIMIGENNENLAIINGRIVKKFDKIGQFIIVQINDRSVEVVRNQQTYTLRLK